MNILAWIVFGLIIGIVARALVPGGQRMSLALTTLLGIAGALAGGFITEAFAHPRATAGLHTASLLGSILGAILLVALASAVGRRRQFTL